MRIMTPPVQATSVNECPAPTARTVRPGLGRPRHRLDQVAAARRALDPDRQAALVARPVPPLLGHDQSLCEDPSVAAMGRVKPIRPEPAAERRLAARDGLDRPPAPVHLVPGQHRRQDRPVLMRMSGGRLKTTFNAPTVAAHPHRREERQEAQHAARLLHRRRRRHPDRLQGRRPRAPGLVPQRRCANPEIELWTKGGGGRYRAREAEGEERERLWSLATSYYPGFASYQERATERRIPVVVCSPAEG